SFCASRSLPATPTENRSLRRQKELRISETIRQRTRHFSCRIPGIAPYRRGNGFAMGSRNGETHEISIERARGVDRVDYWLRVEFPVFTVKSNDRNAGLHRERLVQFDDNCVFPKSGFDLGRRNGHVDEQ